MLNKFTISRPYFGVIYLILLFAIVTKATGQSFTLPDTNFRNVLQKHYPTVMDDGQLNIQAANAFTRDLYLRNSGISDLTGIEHFTSVFKIDASENKLTTLPDLSENKNLKYLYLNHNQINNIDFIFDNTGLLQLQLFNNELTHLPAITGLSNLQQLYLSNNKITTIEDVSGLTNLIDLQIGNNLLEELPDLSQNNKITSLHFHKNSIKDVSGLKALPGITYLYCWNNEITDLSFLDRNTQLKTLVAFGNKLERLPELNNKPDLTILEVANNKLTFDDLLPITDLSLTTFTYAPQDSVGIKTKKAFRKLNQLNLEVSEDKTVTSNSYIWYKNGLPVDTNSSGKLIITNISESDSGSYTTTITNPALPALTLYHNPWEVDILPCMEVLNYGYRVLSKNCEDGTTIEVEVLAEGAQSPFSYTLKSLSGKDTVFSSSPVISNIPPGKYSLDLKDIRKCKLNLDQNLTVYKPSGCNPVIAPSSGGQETSYFIEKTGQVEILDMQGNVIRTLNAPAVWDGTTSNGKLVDAGYYVIILNGKKLTNITVLR